MMLKPSSLEEMAMRAPRPLATKRLASRPECYSNVKLLAGADPLVQPRCTRSPRAPRAERPSGDRRTRQQEQ